MNYKKTCFKNSEGIFKTFFHFVLLEICKLFELLTMALSTKKRLCFAKPSEELEKEWKNGIDEWDRRCRDLLLQELCKKLFNLMDIFGVILSMQKSMLIGYWSHNRYFHQPSPIIFYFIFSSVHLGRIQETELERHGLPLRVRSMGKLLKVSNNYFGPFVLQRIKFCFCLFFKLYLATTTGVDACHCLSFDII